MLAEIAERNCDTSLHICALMSPSLSRRDVHAGYRMPSKHILCYTVGYDEGICRPSTFRTTLYVVQDQDALSHDIESVTDFRSISLESLTVMREDLMKVLRTIFECGENAWTRAAMYCTSMVCELYCSVPYGCVVTPWRFRMIRFLS